MTVMFLMIVDVIDSSTTTVPKTCKTYTHTYTYTYIYIHMYTPNTWALPQPCSEEGYHSQSNVAATLHSIGKINKGIREY